MSTFNMQHCDYRIDRVYVEIDNRFDVALIRTEDGLRIEVFPITDGDPWDDPFDRFEVDESEIRGLEEEMSHD